MGADGDIGAVVDGLKRMHTQWRRSDEAKIENAMRILSETNLPKAILEGFRVEMLQLLGARYYDHTHVYIAFFGDEGRAQFMKIGVAKHVRFRIDGIRTGNPLDCLWTFCCPIGSRAEAGKVEAALHRNMANTRTNGEWFRLSKCSEQACEAIVQSLAELATEICERPIEFTRA